MATRQPHDIRMNVVLPPSLEDYVNRLVQDGSYCGSDEVVKEALREHQARRQGMEVIMTSKLEALLDEGMQDLDHARTTEELSRS